MKFFYFLFIIIIVVLSSFVYLEQSKQILLDDVIEQNKGKVIYIDYWASWCKPCRKEMKYLPKLKNKYNDKIVFIYISMDLNEEKWLEASIKEKISCEKYNFLFSQLKRNNDNNFSNQINFKIKSLPYYLIFDKNGKLVNSNAPRPSEEVLVSELNKYVNE